MTSKDASEKMKNDFTSDILHHIKELARIENKYRPRIVSLTTKYWAEIDQLNERIDRTMGG